MSTRVPCLRFAFGRVSAAVRRASRYDLVLAIIPAAFLGAILVGQLAPVAVQTTVTVASLLGLLAVVDALFFNPPQDPSGGRPPT